MNLIEIEAEINEWQSRNFPNAKSYQPLLGAVEEMGELSHAHLKMEQGIRGTPMEHLMKKKDSVGDILIYLVHYCKLNGFTMEECLATAWHEVKQRDWIMNKQDGTV